MVTRRQFRGAEVFAAELSSLLAGNGHTVLFIGLYPSSENVLTAKDAMNLDLNGKKTGMDPALVSRLLRLIRKEQPDIVQANGSDTLKYAVFSKIFYPGLNIVYRNISMVSAWARQGSVKRTLNQMLFKKVSRVTSVGQQSLEDLVKTYQYPLHKTKLIRRGVRQFVYDAIRSRKKILDEFGIGEPSDLLVHIGQFSPEKNHAFLVECFEKILTQRPGTFLLFIGEGSTLSAVKELVSRKNLSANILFAGHRENVQEILAGCDLFILGSTVEGVPGVILEAGMQSLPTVAVSVGGVNEVVINGETGIVLQKHIPAEFTDAVLSLLEKDSLRKTFGANAKAFVLENYSLQRCLMQFEDLYADILNEKKRKG